MKCSRCRMNLDEEGYAFGGSLLGTKEVFVLCQACYGKLEALEGDPEFGLMPYFDFFIDSTNVGLTEARKKFRQWLKSGRMELRQMR